MRCRLDAEVKAVIIRFTKIDLTSGLPYTKPFLKLGDRLLACIWKGPLLRLSCAEVFIQNSAIQTVMEMRANREGR